MRLFFGLEFPADAKREIFESSGEILAQTDFRYKRVEAENLHITIKYIGDADEKKAETLKEQFSSFSAEGHELIFDTRIGYFYKKDRSFPLFLSILEGDEWLKNLQKNLLKHLRMKPERFSPHLTIARMKNKISSPKDLKFQELEFAFSVHPTAVTLFESRLSKTGPQYFKLMQVLL